MSFLNNKIVNRIIGIVFFVILIYSFVVNYMDNDYEDMILSLLLVLLEWALFQYEAYKSNKEIVKQLKTDTDELTDSIIKDITQNLDHELKTPLVALKQAVKIEKTLMSALSDLTFKGGKRSLDKLIHGCHGNSSVDLKTKDNKTLLTYRPMCEKCELLEKGICSGDNAGFYKTFKYATTSIEKSISSIYDTIEILKDLKRNKKEVNKKKENVYQLIVKSLNMYVLLKRYAFKYHIDEELKKYKLSDYFKNNSIFIQVINNLTQNSLDANASLIKFKLKEYDAKKEMLEIYIIDNGGGIPEDKIDKIFELGISTKGENRGFGMYFTRRVIKNMLDGDISIVKTSKKGTIFSLKLKGRLF